MELMYKMIPYAWVISDRFYNQTSLKDNSFFCAIMIFIYTDVAEERRGFAKQPGCGMTERTVAMAIAAADRFKEIQLGLERDRGVPKTKFDVRKMDLQNRADEIINRPELQYICSDEPPPAYVGNTTSSNPPTEEREQVSSQQIVTPKQGPTEAGTSGTSTDAPGAKRLNIGVAATQAILEEEM